MQVLVTAKVDKPTWEIINRLVLGPLDKERFEDELRSVIQRDYQLGPGFIRIDWQVSERESNTPNLMLEIGEPIGEPNPDIDLSKMLQELLQIAKESSHLPDGILISVGITLRESGAYAKIQRR